MKKLLTIGIILSLGIILTGCGSSEKLKLEKTYIVELGEQVSTDAKIYLKDVEKDVEKDTTVSFEKNKMYTADKKTKVLQPTAGEYLPVGKYQASAKYKEESKKFTVEVRDTIAPKFVDFKKELIIEVNAQNVDLAKYYKADDLSGVGITFDDRKLDLTKEGTYEVKVIASDKYKNVSTKIIKIKVVSMETAEKEGVTPTIEGTTPQSKALNEKVIKDAEKTAQEEPVQPQQPSTDAGSGGNGYTPPTNNPNTGGDAGTVTPPASNVCVPDGTYQGLGNSGKWFFTEAEADSWAWAELDPDTGYWGKQGYQGYHAWTVEDSCGESRPDIWSVHFY